MIDNWFVTMAPLSIRIWLPRFQTAPVVLRNSNTAEHWEQQQRVRESAADPHMAPRTPEDTTESRSLQQAAPLNSMHAIASTRH